MHSRTELLGGDGDGRATFSGDEFTRIASRTSSGRSSLARQARTRPLATAAWRAAL